MRMWYTRLGFCNRCVHIKECGRYEDKFDQRDNFFCGYDAADYRTYDHSYNRITYN